MSIRRKLIQLATGLAVTLAALGVAGGQAAAAAPADASADHAMASTFTCSYNVPINAAQLPGLTATVCVERDGAWARVATWTTNGSNQQVYMWIRAIQTDNGGLGATWGPGWTNPGVQRFVGPSSFTYQPWSITARYDIEYYTAALGWKTTAVFSPPA